MNQKIEEFCLRYVENCFLKSASDRKTLHDFEWESEKGDPSVLGEVEVRADTVSGIARSLQKRNPRNILSTIRILQENSIYRSNTIKSWLIKNSSQFYYFVNYIIAVENLNSNTIELLENKSKGSDSIDN